MENIEQDRTAFSGNDLPTYDDLAAQEGPNSRRVFFLQRSRRLRSTCFDGSTASDFAGMPTCQCDIYPTNANFVYRFGRWRGWIEKRAAERYLAITPEERQRRRERGWGNEEMDALDPEPPTPTTPGLSIQTRNLRISTLSEPPPTARPEQPLPPLPPVSTVLRPTHLKMHHFGSRFLPHTTTPIRCLLPLQADRLLLLGHDEGLSVLDMYPQDWNDSGGLDLKGPEEAVVRTIWEGECVFQMSILELDNASGVVLMLVGPEPESPLVKDSECQRTVRMYNLGSLISLAKWAVANKVSSIPFNRLQQLTRLQGAHPLNLGTFAPQQTPTKKHRPTSSIARGLKSLASGSGSSSQTESSSAYMPLLTPHSSIAGSSSSRSSAPPVRPPPRTNSDESSWEMVDDLPLRWARDFVPLASSGSRLVNLSVLSFALWTRDEGARTGSRGQFLAVATKNNILLYETPPNERAFRFVKEFYTPLQPKGMCFFQQSVQELARSPTDVHNRHRRTSSSTRSVAASMAAATTNYGTQLSIFVVFEKKAGWIRLADSAAGEMELFDTTADPTTNLSSSNTLLTPHSPHSRAASASPSSVRTHEHKHRHAKHASSAASSPDPAHGSGSGGKWLLPVRCELPMPSPSVYVLTRGAMTQILPCPLPIHPAGPARPLAVLRWRSTPTHVAPRVGGEAGEEVLQLTALGEGSVEVLEVPLATLGGAQPAAGGSGSGYGSGNVYGNGNGKGKARAGMDELGVVRAEDDAGGETGFLCVGGYWDDPHQGAAYLQRNASISSDATAESVDAGKIAERLRRAQGVYGWCRKGLADWRVFWVGGAFDEWEDDEEDDL
ncbi:hypothetical protein MSAN_02338200 [Mycena sanguinolenta]|uniref:Uncharacterized protein n=1 Tax=Mycena sanguinolenta TaxID=230812 RepID=A0A8H7CFD6_9AGAR|nr:hypothetical protein MSAN_02338200 [Mycena sanguinolenta]